MRTRGRSRLSRRFRWVRHHLLLLADTPAPVAYRSGAGARPPAPAPEPTSPRRVAGATAATTVAPAPPSGHRPRWPWHLGVAVVLVVMAVMGPRPSAVRPDRTPQAGPARAIAPSADGR